MRVVVRRSRPLGEQVLSWTHVEVRDERGALMRIEDLEGDLDDEPIADDELIRILATAEIAERGPKDFFERLWLAVAQEGAPTEAASDVETG